MLEDSFHLVPEALTFVCSKPLVHVGVVGHITVLLGHSQLLPIGLQEGSVVVVDDSFLVLPGCDPEVVDAHIVVLVGHDLLVVDQMIDCA